MRLATVICLTAAACLTSSSWPATADECDSLAARVIANVHGTTFKRRGMTPDIDLQHPALMALTVHCRVNENLREAVSITSNDKIPSTAFFDLVGHIGSVITGARPDRVARAAKFCHRKALAALGDDEYSEADLAENWGTLKCDAAKFFAKIEITRARGSR